MESQRERCGRIVTLMALLGLCPTVSAAQDSGRIVGRVIDGSTAQPLSSVQVFTSDGALGALTALDGRYVIRNVPAGTYDVTAQLIGYGTKTVTGVTVTSGQSALLDVTLAAQAVALEEIVVTSTAERGSTTALLTERKLSVVVSDGIGADQMSRSPDGDAAAALRRVPGLSVVDGKYAYVRGLGERYSSTTLNGAPLASPEPDKKVIPLDIIPSSLLQSIVTSKSYSPDQPGDYAGGLVQLKTRDFPANRIFNVGVSGGWNSVSTLETGLGYAGGSRDFLGFDDGTRDIPAIIPRDMALTRANFSSESLEQFGKAFDGDWGPTERDIPFNGTLGISYGDDFDIGDDGQRVGFIASANYSSSQNLRDNQIERVFAASGLAEPEVDYRGTITEQNVTVGGLFNVTYQPRSTDQIKFATVYNHLATDRSRIFTGFNLDSSTDQLNTRLQFIEQTLVNSQLEGEHLFGFLGNATFKWRGALTRASRYEPSTRESLYQESNGVFIWDDFIQSGSVFHQDMVDEGWNAGTSLEIPFELADAPAALSVGGSTDRKDREAYTRRFRFRPRGSRIDSEVRTLSPNELFGSGEFIGEDGFEIQEATFRTDNYDAAQDIDAAFVMLDLELLDGLRISGGARVERSVQTVSPKDIFDVGGLAPVEGADLESTDWLPAINATYALNPTMNLRASASRTLARAQLRELAPFSFADYAGGYLVIGNPSLDLTRIDNYDVRYEWFGGPQAVFAVSGFYKRFDAPIEVSVLPSSELIKTWANADGADNYGLEFEVRSDLGFLSEGLSSLSFNGNLTLVESEVETGSRIRVYLPGTGETDLAVVPKNRGLQGQSPYVVNAGLTWAPVEGGATATVLFNRFGRRIDAVGGQATPDIFEEARSTLDAVVEWPVRGGWKAKLSASRLLGNVVEFTQGGDLLRQYDAGRSLSLGLSWGVGR